MNSFLQENLFAIILFLMLIILLLIALIAIILVKLLLSPKDNKTTSSNNTPPLPETKLEKEVIVLKKLSEEHVEEKFYCENHPESPSVAGCLICEDVFCEKCVIDHDGMHFCKEHFKIFANNKWKQITDVKTTPDTPEDGLFIYHFKRKIWREDKTPSFVLTHYKINIESDIIESFIQLNVRDVDAIELALEIKKVEASR
jgi:hypothetical protein